MSHKQHPPHFRDLTRAEIDAILKRNMVGRIAFVMGRHVDMEPIHFVYDAPDWIYIRTSFGTKVASVEHHPWVALEVDEVEDIFRWRSVVVHGAVHLLNPDKRPTDKDPHARAIELLRNIIPETLTAEDPVPERNVLLRVHIDEIRGRGAAPGP